MNKTTYLIFIAGLLSFKTFSQNVAIELEKMNVFYIAIDNPFKVIVQNYTCDSIVLKSKCGTISNTKENCHYIYYTDSCHAGREYIYVGVKNNEKIKWIDTLNYRLKRIPDPVVMAGANYYCHFIDKNELLRTRGLHAELLNLDIELNFEVLQYSIEIKRENKTIYKKSDIFSNKFSDELISEIEKSKSGDKYLFFDVAIKTPNKCTQKLSGPNLTIE